MPLYHQSLTSISKTLFFHSMLVHVNEKKGGVIVESYDFINSNFTLAKFSK
jgi:hypothetical protein